MDSLAPDQQALVTAFLEVPDPVWLAFTSTSDQAQHWYELKQLYFDLSLELKSYFLGTESHLGKSKEHREIAASADYYLSFYALIREAWRDVKKALVAEGISANTCTPGEVLKGIIYFESAYNFSVCLQGHFTWTGRGAAKETKIALAAIADPMSKEYSIRTYGEKLNCRVEQNWDYYRFQVTVLRACHKAALKDSRVQKKLKIYQDYLMEMQKELAKNPQQKASFGFQMGIAISPSRHGGTWS